VISGDS
jgi:hypothetical protein